jgi:hypothetical protein
MTVCHSCEISGRGDIVRAVDETKWAIKNKSSPHIASLGWPKRLVPIAGWGEEVDLTELGEAYY